MTDTTHPLDGKLEPEARDGVASPSRSRFLNGKWCGCFGGGDWRSCEPQPTVWSPRLTFRALLDENTALAAELSRLRSEVERATGHVRNLVNERGCPSCGGAPTNAKRAARDFLNGLGGEG